MWDKLQTYKRIIEFANSQPDPPNVQLVGDNSMVFNTRDPHHICVFDWDKGILYYIGPDNNINRTNYRGREQLLIMTINIDTIQYISIEDSEINIIKYIKDLDIQLDDFQKTQLSRIISSDTLTYYGPGVKEKAENSKYTSYLDKEPLPGHVYTNDDIRYK